MEYTFCELKSKDVVNLVDGRKLGRINDLVLNAQRGTVCGIVVPGERSFRFFRPAEDIYIPWGNILRIGEDVILVRIMLAPPSCGRPPKRGRRSYASDGFEHGKCCDPNGNSGIAGYLTPNS